jgi:hypothetical protein
MSTVETGVAPSVMYADFVDVWENQAVFVTVVLIVWSSFLGDAGPGPEFGHQSWEACRRGDLPQGCGVLFTLVS